MQSVLMQLGVGGIFAILVIREVMMFLKTRNGTSSPKVVALSEADRKMLVEVHEWSKELHTWHNIHDEDGVKIWYVRRSLEDAVERLTTTIEKLSEFQRANFDVLKEMARDMRDLRRNNLQ